MVFAKQLANKNSVLAQSSCNSSYVKLDDSYSFHFVFTGTETCFLPQRRVNIYPNCFGAFGSESNFTAVVDSCIPVKTLGITIGKSFADDFQQQINVNSHSMLDGGRLNSTYPMPEGLMLFKGDIKFNVNQIQQNLSLYGRNELLLNEHLHYFLNSYYQLYNEQVYSKLEKLNFVKSKTRLEILKRLSLAKDYIHSNHNKLITLDDIAINAYLSVNHLLRTFKEAFQLTPYQYLISVRLESAKNYLLTTNFSIKEIVSLIGFESSSSFIRLFRNEFGITPLNFKKINYN